MSAGYPRPFGRARRRDLARLEVLVDGWTDGPFTVLRHEHPSLTRDDVDDVLERKGYRVVDEDIDGVGWPLRVARSDGPAPGGDPAERRLAAELQRATDGGRGLHLLGLVPFRGLSRDRVEILARRESWLLDGDVHDVAEPTLRLVRPGRPAVDQFAGDGEAAAAPPAPYPADRPVFGSPWAVRGAVLAAFFWLAGLAGVLALLRFGITTDRTALTVVMVLVTVVLPFVVLGRTVRAVRRLVAYRRLRRAVHELS